MFCIALEDTAFLTGISGVSFELTFSPTLIFAEGEEAEFLGDDNDDNDDDDDDRAGVPSAPSSSPAAASFWRSGISMLSICGRTRISAISVRTMLAMASVTMGSLLEMRDDAEESSMVSNANSISGSLWNPIHIVRDGGGRHITRSCPANFFTYTTIVSAAVMFLGAFEALLLLRILLLARMELPMICEDTFEIVDDTILPTLGTGTDTQHASLTTAPPL